MFHHISKVYTFRDDYIDWVAKERLAQIHMMEVASLR